MIMMFALLLAAAPVPAEPAGTPTGAEAAVIANCDAHKFETTVHTTIAGKPRSSKVKLCGKVGQTDADWLRTLKDAVKKVSADAGMSIAVKEQIIAALDIEIARLSPTSEISGPNLVAPPPIAGAPIGGRVEYSALPPMPAPIPAAPAVAMVASAPRLPAPRLTFRCLATTRLGAEGPCELLERDTLLTVRADENLPGGVGLRFLRRGDNRGEIDLPTLRSGQSRRFALPPRLCAGVAGSRVEIQIVRAGKGTPQVVDTRGPFELRC